jgi:thiosulfate dehydrogenase [quinone] large subunit
MATMTAWSDRRETPVAAAPAPPAPAAALTGRQGLALLRIGLGLLFLISALDKTMKGWLGSGQALTQTLQSNLPKAEGFYRPLLEGTVLPQADRFAQLVTIGEWVAGLSLTLGLLTRLGALTALWLLLNFMAMKGILFGQWLNPMSNSDRVYAVAALACCLAAAGLTWGLDGRLRRVLAGLPLAGWLAGVRRAAAGARAAGRAGGRRTVARAS